MGTTIGPTVCAEGAGTSLAAPREPTRFSMIASVMPRPSRGILTGTSSQASADPTPSCGVEAHASSRRSPRWCLPSESASELGRHEQRGAHRERIERGQSHATAGDGGSKVPLAIARSTARRRRAPNTKKRLDRGDGRRARRLRPCVAKGIPRPPSCGSCSSSHGPEGRASGRASWTRACGSPAGRRIVLWTNDVLVDARRIYERAGFDLLDEHEHHSFGHDLVGQHWGRDL